MYRKKDDWFETSHWLTTMEATLQTLWASAAPLGLDVPAPIDHIPAWRGDVDGVQDGPQYLAERSGETV